MYSVVEFPLEKRNRELGSYTIQKSINTSKNINLKSHKSSVEVYFYLKRL